MPGLQISVTEPPEFTIELLDPIGAFTIELLEPGDTFTIDISESEGA